jgi:CheY-like chemotaxis protein
MTARDRTVGGGPLPDFLISPGTAVTRPPKALRILVAEDDAMIGVLLADLLSGMGHDCKVAASEAAAVIDAIRYGPDLMIVDAQLGSGSGIAAVDAVLESGPMPHVFVTGDARRVSELRPLAVVLQKPFREADLARAIRQAFGNTAAP